MHRVKHEHLPEVHERTVFPFGPSRPVSPAPSRLSTGALSRTVERMASTTSHPHTLTSHGLEFTGEPGPALHNGLRSTQLSRSGQGAITGSLRGDMAGLDKTHSRHNYSATHAYGHHNVANNVNPFLAHYRMPKWETTGSLYGEHYQHPQQTYTRVQRNRMPVFHIQA